MFNGAKKTKLEQDISRILQGFFFFFFVILYSPFKILTLTKNVFFENSPGEILTAEKKKVFGIIKNNVNYVILVSIPHIGYSVRKENIQRNYIIKLKTCP